MGPLNPFGCHQWIDVSALCRLSLTPANGPRQHRNIEGKIGQFRKPTGTSMLSIDKGRNELFAALASEMEAADEDWQRAAEGAFERLHALDPELLKLAIRALLSNSAAADFFARKFVYADHGNGYAALATGKRDKIIARLNEFIAGEAGAHT